VLLGKDFRHQQQGPSDSASLQAVVELLLRLKEMREVSKLALAGQNSVAL
jgi:hypothetical protein